MVVKVAVPNVVNTINSDTFPPDVDTNNHNGDSIVLAYESRESIHQVPLFDVNKPIIDDKCEWALLVKDGLRKHIQWFEQHCSDFKNWRAQFNFQFSFVPLPDCTLSDTKYMGPFIECPMANQSNYYR